MSKHGKHENYEILNLIGYGLAKFNIEFILPFGFSKKMAFYNYIVEIGLAETVGTVKNRQDLFDPFFDNGRRGWHQKGDAYIHRKLSIDNFFGSLDATDYADIVKMYIRNNYGVVDMPPRKTISPVKKSQFKQLQATGYGAEIFFMKNYQSISSFESGVLEDARMLGDGYDFQVSVKKQYFLAEVKGMQGASGGIRMTKNEFQKAREYGSDYALVVVAKLTDVPQMQPVFDPTKKLHFTKKSMVSKQLSYHANFSLDG